MKKIIGFLWLVLVSVCSCNTKVDLYTDFVDTAIVYGVMDVAQDTNFVKIARAFSASDEQAFDVNQVAMIADSFNYPGKLDARFIEFKSFYGSSYVPTGREILLDTITLHNKKEGMFYAPDQKMYYTTEKFNINEGKEKYKYKLWIRKNNDTITSEIGLLGSKNLQISTRDLFFRSNNSLRTHKIVFTPDDNEAIYEFNMQFNYKELRAGQDTIKKEVHWSLGAFSMFDLGYENGSCFVTYPENSLFKILSDAIGNDILNVERFFDSFVISISLYGKELHDYTQMNIPSNGFSQSVGDYSYTNIHGGFGVFSSRYLLRKELRISSLTQTDLLHMPWGFKNMGYMK